MRRYIMEELSIDELHQIKKEEPPISRQIFDQYTKGNKSLKKIAEQRGMKYHRILRYSKQYHYRQRKKLYQQKLHELRLMEYHCFEKVVKLPVCPECSGDTFQYDEYHYELYCKSCGMVIHAPPNADFIPSGYEYQYIKCNFKDIEVIVG